MRLNSGRARDPERRDLITQVQRCQTQITLIDAELQRRAGARIAPPAPLPAVPSPR
jgi:hypothetical protein